MISANKCTFSHLALQHFIRDNTKVWCSFDITQIAFSVSVLFFPGLFYLSVLSKSLHEARCLAAKNEVYGGYA